MDLQQLFQRIWTGTTCLNVYGQNVPADLRGECRHAKALESLVSPRSDSMAEHLRRMEARLRCATTHWSNGR